LLVRAAQVVADVGHALRATLAARP
jgi:hypothetical protein